MSDSVREKSRVLYIEDNFESRFLVRRILESHGYEFFEASDAREGLKAVKLVSPDLILMDINLPDLNGFEATTRIKSQERYRHIPVVALTARVLPGERERAIISGCEGYIPKPIDVETFADKVREYLNGGLETLEIGDELNYLRQYTNHLIDRLERQIELSLMDELTGVGNMHYAMLRLSEEIARCRRQRRPASVLFFDINSLKRINTEFGYDAGNEVLKETARLLRANRRRFDVLARVQKDEFFLFLFNVDTAAARCVGERIAAQVQDGFFASGIRRIPVTISIKGCGLDLTDSTLTARAIVEICATGGTANRHRGLQDGFEFSGHHGMEDSGT